MGVQTIKQLGSFPIGTAARPILRILDPDRLRTDLSFRTDFAILIKSISHEIRNRMSSFAIFSFTHQKGNQVKTLNRALSELLELKDDPGVTVRRLQRLFNYFEKLLVVKPIEQKSSFKTLEPKIQKTIVLAKQLLEKLQQLLKSGEFVASKVIITIEGENSLTAEINRSAKESSAQGYDLSAICNFEQIKQANIIADPILLHIVFMNLFSNARVAMEKRGANESIEISAYQENSMLVLKIRDKGCGMNPDFVAALNDQDPLRGQITTSDQTDGKQHGLGTIISMGYVRKMGGHLYIEESVEDVGTTFVLTLPLAVAN